MPTLPVTAKTLFTAMFNDFPEGSDLLELEVVPTSILDPEIVLHTSTSVQPVEINAIPEDVHHIPNLEIVATTNQGSENGEVENYVTIAATRKMELMADDDSQDPDYKPNDQGRIQDLWKGGGGAQRLPRVPQARRFLEGPV